jgi:protein-disulfide isomerase
MLNRRPFRTLASATALLAGLVAFMGACRGGSPNVPQDAKAEGQQPAPAAEQAAAPPPPGRRVASAGPARPLQPEEAQKLMPRADLSGLTPEQLGQLFEIAGDTFDYAGCNSTLAACLRADVKDKHAPRMAALASMLIRDGFSSSQVVDMLERYYPSFAQAKRFKLRTDDCATLGPAKAPITFVEFSDYQCPHCAGAVKPLHELVEKANPNVRLCSKYFPLQQHPRAAIAASVAEYARSKGKFWPMNELLFQNQEQLDDGQLKSFATQLKLDGNEMLKQAYGGKFDATIDSHKAEATAAGIRATPTLYVNGRVFTLPLKLDYLMFTVDDELEWLRAGGAWEKD